MKDVNVKSESWVEGLHLDTADSLSRDHGELDVSSITPASAPGVLDEPVVLAALGSPSGSEHGVVKSGSTFSAVKDTATVELENRLVGLNGDGEGLLCKGGLHGGDVVGGDVSVASGLHAGLGLARVLARANSSAS